MASADEVGLNSFLDHARLAEPGVGLVLVNEIKQSLTIKPKVPAEFRTAVAEGQIFFIIVQPTLYDTGVLRLRKAAMDQDENALATYGKVLPWLDIKPAKTSFSIVKTTN